MYIETEEEVSGISQMNNLTHKTDFILLGFRGVQHLRLALFSVLSVTFSFTLCGNLLIIALVFTSRSLHTPMYFFISQLSFTDIMLSTDIVPVILYTLLNDRGSITFIGCMAQLFSFCVAEGSECFLLTVMSYDRYVAICNPLRYTSIMTRSFCVTSVIMFWLVSSVFAFFDILVLSRLKFCGPNVIDHVFCDVLPLLELACSDTFPMKLQMYLLSIPILIIPSVIIAISYSNIVRAILQISSNISRQKAFSTCSSHLIVVSIFYWTIFCVYVLPRNGETSNINKLLSLLYTVFNPLVNPIIYSLRNKDIAKAVQEAFKRFV